MNVQQKTIKPLILQTVATGTLIYTDEYAIYNRLEEWGFAHKTVNHSADNMRGTKTVTVFVKCIIK